MKSAFFPVECRNCGKLFPTTEYRLSTGRGRYCSSKCRVIVSTEAMRLGRGPEWLRKVRKNISNLHPSGKDHYAWSGDKPSYSALHHWVNSKLGSPKRCEQCGLSDPNRKYHWANIDHSYRRTVSDYKRMCVPCHRKHDRLISYHKLFSV